jgi:BolA protein
MVASDDTHKAGAAVSGVERGGLVIVEARLRVETQRVVNRMSRDERIRDKLSIGLKPSRLEVVNESHMHAGHAGSPGTGESHYRVLVVAEAFQGLSRVARHRLVNDLVADEFRAGLHALAVSAAAPGEAQS